jgi:hypothetical protein
MNQIRPIILLIRVLCIMRRKDESGDASHVAAFIGRCLVGVRRRETICARALLTTV